MTMTDEELSKAYAEEMMRQILQEQESLSLTSIQLANHIKTDHKREILGWEDYEDLKVSHHLMHDVQNNWDHRH